MREIMVGYSIIHDGDFSYEIFDGVIWINDFAKLVLL
jgi:hypothetical protein